MYRTIIFIIILIGIICVTIAVVKSQTKIEIENQSNNGNENGNGNEKPEVIYKYIPRTFEEEQEQPVYVSEIFDTMFSQPSPWIISIRNYDQRKQEKINKYFISQM